jgi:hypothetical protein
VLVCSFNDGAFFDNMRNFSGLLVDSLPKFKQMQRFLDGLSF